MIYQHAAVGGTFDRLHDGHAELLKTAFKVARRVTIGLTSDKFVSNKILAQLIESYEQRYYSLSDWLRNNQIDSNRYKITQLDNIYGPTITDPELDCLVVSVQTLINADKINQQRRKNGLPAVKIITTQMIEDSEGQYLSSTNIRSGISNRLGDRFDAIFNRDFKLDTETISKLHTPLGEQLIELDKINQKVLNGYTSVWLVGDVVTDDFISKGLSFDRAIIDGRTKRREYSFKNFDPMFLKVINNPPHQITTQAAIGVMRANKGEVVRINGEEDLLALVGVIVAPLNSAIFYGRPNKGLGMIVVTEEIKEYYYKLLMKSQV